MAKYYEAYEKRYRQVHEKSLSWASEESSPIVLETMRKYGLSDSASILDVGCGEGRDCLHLMNLGYDVQAIDISAEAIHYCQRKADEKNRDRFHVVDVCADDFEGRFDFIYSVATLHMLVLGEDRRQYFSFIKNHLSDNGYALILSMGDGQMESESDISNAFTDQKRTHQATGEALMIAATSCKIVNFETFRAELRAGGFTVIEDGLTEIKQDFPVIMYAVVR